MKEPEGKRRLRLHARWRLPRNDVDYATTPCGSKTRLKIVVMKFRLEFFPLAINSRLGCTFGTACWSLMSFVTVMPPLQFAAHAPDVYRTTTVPMQQFISYIHFIVEVHEGVHCGMMPRVKPGRNPLRTLHPRFPTSRHMTWRMNQAFHHWNSKLRLPSRSEYPRNQGSYQMFRPTTTVRATTPSS